MPDPSFDNERNSARFSQPGVFLRLTITPDGKPWAFVYPQATKRGPWEKPAPKDPFSLRDRCFLLARGPKKSK